MIEAPGETRRHPQPASDDTLTKPFLTERLSSHDGVRREQPQEAQLREPAEIEDAVSSATDSLKGRLVVSVTFVAGREPVVHIRGKG